MVTYSKIAFALLARRLSGSLAVANSGAAGRFTGSEDGFRLHSPRATIPTRKTARLAARRQIACTFLKDTEHRPILRATLWQQAQKIAAELKEKHLAAKTVQVRVRYGDFTTLTRQLTLDGQISERRDIYRLGCLLLAKHRLVPRPLRLIGLGVSGLGPPSQQLLLPLDVDLAKDYKISPAETRKREN